MVTNMGYSVDTIVARTNELQTSTSTSAAPPPVGQLIYFSMERLPIEMRMVVLSHLPAALSDLLSLNENGHKSLCDTELRFGLMLVDWRQQFVLVGVDNTGQFEVWRP